MMWSDEDCDIYHTRRLKADSLLQILREQCKEFIRPEQVDSLRTLLLNKEEHLFQMNRMDIPGTEAHRQPVGQPVFTRYITN